MSGASAVLTPFVWYSLSRIGSNTREPRSGMFSRFLSNAVVSLTNSRNVSVPDFTTVAYGR